MSEFAPRYLKNYQSPDFSITTVNLTVELDEQATKVTSVLSIVKNGTHTNPLVLDGEHLTLLSVSKNQIQLTPEQYQLTDTTLTLDGDDEFELCIVTEINPKENTALEGIFKSGDSYCSQCEAEGFRRITFYLDRPDVMATFTTKVIANKKEFPYLLSNGNKIDSGDLDNGLHYVTWFDPFPKPCYLFALVAGDYDLLSDTYKTKSGKDVALEIFVDKGNLKRAEHAMVSLKKSMLWDEEQFNLEYDLDIYMIVAVSFFNMGAMENKGLNVFNSKFVLADDLSATDDDFFNVEAVIAHEYFHNWTGNRVTCRDWFQLSLKEGLTVFRDQQFSADMHSKAVTRIKNVRIVRAQQFAEDAGPMAHPIRPEKVIEMNNFYTLTVYEKGSEVIRMLHTLLGDTGFNAGIKLYFERFDGQAVTCDDFVKALSDANNKDLSQFQRWYSQSGTPLLVVNDSYDAETSTYTLTIKQTHPETHDKQQKHNLLIPVNVELINESNQQSFHQQLLELSDTQQQFIFENITEKPIPALLANFSAPVKLQFEYSDQQLLALILSAKDEYIRWDAGQKLFANYIKVMVADEHALVPDSILTMVSHILHSEDDFAFKAEQLIMPSFDELAEEVKNVDPLALVNAIEKMKSFIAKGLFDDFVKVYEQNYAVPFSKTGDAIGARALKNVCLDYITPIQDNGRVKEQYSTASNMTDQIASLKIAAINDLPYFQEIMSLFAEQWADNELVMDKWFTVNALQSNPNAIENIIALLEHKQFSLNNPNRARSLIGAFAFYNHKYFHQLDGKGYQFLSNQIEKLNGINPQVASRILTPLIQYKGFNQVHQDLMKPYLIELNTLPKLSKDVQEKLSATLD